MHTNGSVLVCVAARNIQRLLCFAPIRFRTLMSAMLQGNLCVHAWSH